MKSRVGGREQECKFVVKERQDPNPQGLGSTEATQTVLEPGLARRLGDWGPASLAS